MVATREDLEMTFTAEAAKRGSTVLRSDLAHLPSLIAGQASARYGVTSSLATLVPSLQRASEPDGSWPATVIVRGRLGVAATGSVAVTEPDRQDRSMIFLARRIIFLLPTGSIVAGLPDATVFLRRALGAGMRYVTFISGPSRTSDIEQIAIVGAHGPGESIVVWIPDWHPADD